MDHSTDLTPAIWPPPTPPLTTLEAEAEAEVGLVKNPQPQPPPPPPSPPTEAKEAKPRMGREGNGSKKSKTTSLAPGFRFHPTDEELVSYYLKRKVCNKAVRIDAIADVDVYRNDPWHLGELSKLKTRDREWYFFSALDKKYGNGGRMNRTTGKGYWKATGKDREICRESQVIAMKKTLVFHQGRAPAGQRTDWVMHEYRLIEEELKRLGAAVQADTYVLCRVFYKAKIGPPTNNMYAPFLEEEWDDVKLSIPEEAADEVEVHRDLDTEIQHVEQDSGSVSKDSVCSDERHRDTLEVMPVCKTDNMEERPPESVLNTEGSCPLLQYKRRKHNHNSGPSHSDGSGNSNGISLGNSSPSTTTTTVPLPPVTIAAESALLEFCLLGSSQVEENHTNIPSEVATPGVDVMVPSSCMMLINDLQNEVRKLSAERDSLRLEVMSIQAMVNILRSRIDFLSRENEFLKKLNPRPSDHR